MSTLKKSIITHLSAIPLVEGMENNSIIVMTPAGTYTGKPVSSKNDNSETVLSFVEILSEFADKYRQDNQIAENESLDGNDGYLMLKDVQLQTSGSTINMPFAILFFDQIVGITIGNAE